MKSKKKHPVIVSEDDDDQVDLSRTLPKPKTKAAPLAATEEKKGDDGDTSGEEKFDEEFEKNDGFVLRRADTKNLLQNNLIVAQRYMYGRGSEKTLKPK